MRGRGCEGEGDDETAAVTMTGKLHLGCPLWSHAAWRGTLFTREARREDFLPQYARVFDTTEGNATFYGLPARETVARWAEEAPATFRFCWKFPRTISHDRQLVGTEVDAETREFLERVAPLGERNGLFFLQLHASFGPERLRDLERFLRGLAREAGEHALAPVAVAVEVRHASFYDGAAQERALDDVLRDVGAERVVFDTRALFASRVEDDATDDARRRKPRLPVRPVAIGRRPFVRFVGDAEVARNDGYLRAWAKVVARWLAEGRSPFFFVHHPDDTHAPALARRFQEIVHGLSPHVPAPPAWPGAEEPREPRADQLSLL